MDMIWLSVTITAAQVALIGWKLTGRQTSWYVILAPMEALAGCAATILLWIMTQSAINVLREMIGIGLRVCG